MVVMAGVTGRGGGGEEQRPTIPLWHAPVHCLHGLTHLTITPLPLSCCYYYPHSTAVDIESQDTLSNVPRITESVPSILKTRGLLKLFGKVSWTKTPVKLRSQSLFQILSHLEKKDINCTLLRVGARGTCLSHPLHS